MLLENGHELPKDCRTLHTRKNIVTKSLEEGEYIYYGVKSSLEKILLEHLFLDEDIKLLISIDGLPLFKSSSMQPILILFHKFQPVPVALYEGYLKPNMNEFLREFVAEIKTLISSPAQILNKKYNIPIFCLTWDAPARSLLKGIIQHTAY